MIEETYVSFETAKLLKDKGFQQMRDNCGYFTTDMVYSISADKEGEHHFANQYPAGVFNKDKYIAAPTQQMAMRWLREIKHIHIATEPYAGYKTHSCFIWKNGMGINWQTSFHTFKTYEEACEEAIKFSLKHLIN